MGVVIVLVAALLQMLSCGLGKMAKIKRERPAHARGGYTLIELLCVLGIVAIIMSMVGVAWTALHPHRKYDAAVSDLHAGISLARQYAVAHNEPVIVVFVEPTSYGQLNNGAAIERCGWAVLAAGSRTWVKAFTALDGAVFVPDSMWPERRNVVGLSDGGSSWQLLYTNIPDIAVVGTTNPPARMFPGVAITADGRLHLGHGGVVDRCMKPKGVVLAPGQYRGGSAPVVTGPRRVSVSVTAAGGVFVDELGQVAN